MPSNRPRSPEILTEPTLPDTPDAAYEFLFSTDAPVNTVAARLAVWKSVPQGQVSIDTAAAAEFIRYWQAVGPRLAGHGIRERAELEATFDLALAAAGCEGWKCFGGSRDDVMVYTPESGPPLFSARWVYPGDRYASSFGGEVEEGCWFSEQSAWLNMGKTGHHSATIAELLESWMPET